MRLKIRHEKLKLSKEELKEAQEIYDNIIKEIEEQVKNQVENGDE